MDFDVLGLGHNLQILRSVVAFIAVDVVHYFPWAKRPSYFGFCNYSMFVTLPHLSISFTSALITKSRTVVHPAPAGLLLAGEQSSVMAVFIGIGGEVSTATSARF
jgi:hypothetical protein